MTPVMFSNPKIKKYINKLHALSIASNALISAIEIVTYEDRLWGFGDTTKFLNDIKLIKSKIEDCEKNIRNLKEDNKYVIQSGK